MMKKIRAGAAQMGLGVGAIYLLFLLPSISELFSPNFVILVKQVLVIFFAICLGLNPQSLIDLGLKLAPKIIDILNIISGNKKSQS